MKNSVLFIFFCFLMASCQDDDFPLENRDETIKGQWSFRSITLTPAIDLNNDGIPNTNGFEEVDTCLLDDLFFFGDTAGETNVFRIDENASRCNDTPQGTTTKFRDNYMFNNDKTILNFVESDIIYFIQEVSKTTLELEFDEVIDGKTIRVNYIFSRD